MVNAGVHKPQTMRAGTAPDHGQRDDGVSPSNRTGSGRRRHSQAASMRQCAAPDRGQRDESVTPSSRTAAVGAGIHKPQPMRAGARNAQRICSANRDQRSDGVSPSSRTAAVAADRRKPQSMRQAPRQITDSVTRACPHRAAQTAVAAGIHKPQTDASRSQYGQARAMHSAFARQIATSTAMACPHRATQAAVGTGRRKPQSMRSSAAPDHGQRDESVPPSSRAGSGRRRQTQAAVNATSAAPDHGQHSESVPPSSRAGVRFPPPLTREKQPLKRGPHAGAAFCAPFNIFTRYNGFAARLFVASSGALSQKALI